MTGLTPMTFYLLLVIERNTTSLTKVLYNFFTSKEKDDDRTEQYQTQF